MAGSIQDIINSVNKIKFEDVEDNEVARVQAVDAMRKALYRLQLPTERILGKTVGEPFIFAALQTFKDLGLWEVWAADKGDKSIGDLVKMANTDVETNLLRRLSRLLAADGIIEEVAEDRYKPTAFSLGLGCLEAAWIQAVTDHCSFGAQNLPTFLQDTSYREPVDPANTAYIVGNPEKLEFWARCKANPALEASFTGLMSSWSRHKVPWPSFFDTNLLLQDFDANGPLLVDVGGNVGNDLEFFLERHRDVPSGSLILQDRPETLVEAKVSEKITVMPYDFFTPQPVVNSRAYFFHAVFHDWPDSKGIQILQQVATAMKRGYSKLLIADIVLPLTGATLLQTTLDVQMMAVVAALERTERMWENLLEQAGFKVVKWWKDPRGYETLIEAELV